MSAVFAALLVASGAMTTMPVGAAAAAGPPTVPVAVCAPVRTYRIVSGDTLSGIARRFGLSVDWLLQANPQHADPNRLQIGDTLSIPRPVPSGPTDIGTLGGRRSEALGINRRGEIVGWSDTERSGARAFVWRQGAMTALPTLGGGFGQANAINERGWIVGTSWTRSGKAHAVLWRDGIALDLGTLGGTRSSATAINDKGQIVGSSETRSGETHAFIWRDGVMTDIGSYGGRYFVARAINERGQVVGEGYDEAGRLRPFLWQGSVISDPTRAVPQGRWSQATASGIDDAGVIVGDVTDASGAPHAYRLWPTARFVALDMRSLANAVNARGQVVGSRTDGSVEDRHAILWEGSSVIEIGASVPAWSTGDAINDCGDAVGRAGASESMAHAYIWPSDRP